MKRYKKIRRILIFILTLVLMLGISKGVTLVEADTAVDNDVEQVIFNKKLNLENTGTVNPEFTVEFEIVRHDMQGSQYNALADMPIPTFVTGTNPVTFNQADGGDVLKFSKEVKLDLPDYNYVGIYTYKITEKATNVAGLVIDTKEYYLDVTVTNYNGGLERNAAQLYYYQDNEEGESVRAPEKVSEIINLFKAGKLTIGKEVTGNYGDTERYFKIDLELNAPDGLTVIDDPITVSDTSYQYGQNQKPQVEFSNGSAALELWLKDGEQVTISNLPYGVTYTIEEDDLTLSGHTYVSGDITDAKIINAETQGTTIVNNREVEPDTGINLDNLPYIVILVIVTGGLVGFTLKKRRTN